MLRRGWSGASRSENVGSSWSAVWIPGPHSLHLARFNLSPIAPRACWRSSSLASTSRALPRMCPSSRYQDSHCNPLGWHWSKAVSRPNGRPRESEARLAAAWTLGAWRWCHVATATRLHAQGRGGGREAGAQGAHTGGPGAEGCVRGHHLLAGHRDHRGVHGSPHPHHAVRHGRQATGTKAQATLVDPPPAAAPGGASADDGPGRRREGRLTEGGWRARPVGQGKCSRRPCCFIYTRRIISSSPSQ